MITAIFAAGVAVGIITYVVKHDRKPMHERFVIGDEQMLDFVVERMGSHLLPADLRSVYLYGHRPFSEAQVREMLSYYEAA